MIFLAKMQYERWIDAHEGVSRLVRVVCVSIDLHLLAHVPPPTLENYVFDAERCGDNASSIYMYVCICIYVNVYVNFQVRLVLV